MKDRDRNEGQYIFPAVSYYKFPSEEFDFYIRNGRKDADESKGLRGRIQNVSYGRLKPYFDEEMEDDLRKYRKIRNKMRSKMSDEEIKLFIKVEQRRMDFIRKASIEQKEDKRFLIVGLWEAHYRLDLIQLFHQKKAPWVGEDYFHGMSEMLCLCIELICEEQGEIEDDLYNEKERNSILWDVILDIGNAMTFILISNNFDIPPRITVEEIRLIWSHIRTFDEEAALKKLKENFVRPLIERDQHLDDFIKLNLWCNYRELSNKEERRLEKAFLVVFEFLKLLAIRSNDYKKDGIKGNGDKNSDIRIDVAELDKLKENLKRIGVDIEIDRFEKSYQGYHIEEYFPKRYENRYRDIRNRIKKLVAKRKMLSAKTIIEDYLNAILIKSNDVWYIPEERKKGSDGMLCDGLFEDIFFVLYRDHIVTMDIFDKKQAVRDLTQKYDFNKEIGF